jgi:hypothetical protein
MNAKDTVVGTAKQIAAGSCLTLIDPASRRLPRRYVMLSLALAGFLLRSGLL